MKNSISDKISSVERVKLMVVNAMVEVYKSRNKAKDNEVDEVRNAFETMLRSQKGQKRIIELANYYKRNTKNPSTKQIMENVEVLVLLLNKK